MTGAASRRGKTTPLPLHIPSLSFLPLQAGIVYTDAPEAPYPLKPNQRPVELPEFVPVHLEGRMPGLGIPSGGVQSAGDSDRGRVSATGASAGAGADQGGPKGAPAQPAASEASGRT
jgi:hypothetical protein